MKQPVLHEFDDSATLAVQLAERVGQALRTGIALRETATLIVSGGRTPVKFLEALSQQELEWRNVHVFLADERWVPAHDDRSNAGFLGRYLLNGAAADAHFQPLHDNDLTAHRAAELLGEQLTARPLPIDAVILGLGSDGHTASLFPDAPELKKALSSDAGKAAVMSPSSQPEVRISMTPAALTNAGFLAIHIEGREKRGVYEQALRPGSAEELPIRAILRNDIVTPEVYWCP